MDYSVPSMEVVELKLRDCLLTGSNVDGTINETVNLNGFDNLE